MLYGLLFGTCLAIHVADVPVWAEPYGGLHQVEMKDHGSMTAWHHKLSSKDFAMVHHIPQDAQISLDMKPSLLISCVGDTGAPEVKNALEGIGLRLPPVTNPAEDNIIASMNTGFVGKLLQLAGGALSPELFKRDATLWESVSTNVRSHVVASAYALLSKGHESSQDPKDIPWGMKDPVQPWLLPAFDEVFENHTKYLMVVRDPRDMLTNSNQNMFMNLGSFHMKSSDPLDFWTRAMTQIMDLYEEDPRFQIVRVEDLVMPDPATDESSARVLACLAEFAGLPPPSPDASRAVLTEMHKHRGSYMGQHGGLDSDSRAVLEWDVAARLEAQPQLARLMKRLGYHSKHYGRIQPQSSRICSGEEILREV
mmetsp:Transcript_150035/g.264810  ORF Transcript_150035/g.264810 Transcript_150035/m.264810 type:complete len:367 (+) Transcript_150035:77-1177(+)